MIFLVFLPGFGMAGEVQSRNIPVRTAPDSSDLHWLSELYRYLKTDLCIDRVGPLESEPLSVPEMKTTNFVYQPVGGFAVILAYPPEAGTSIGLYFNREYRSIKQMGKLMIPAISFAEGMEDEEVIDMLRALGSPDDIKYEPALQMISIERTHNGRTFTMLRFFNDEVDFENIPSYEESPAFAFLISDSALPH